jgi:hypothetical protein
VNLDSVFAGADILRICREFYAGIGLPIDDVIDRSDLYEKPGKSPHAFCTDIDREGDVRVLANIVPNEYWMGTMLHELGHSVYSSKNISEMPTFCGRRLHPAPRVAMSSSGSGRPGCKFGVSVPIRPPLHRSVRCVPIVDLLALVPGHAAVREEHV